MGNAAMGGDRTKNSYLREGYYRLAARCGKRRAIVATEQSLLTAIWHMLVNNVDYHELGPNHFTRRAPTESCAASPNKPTHSASPSASSPSQRPRGDQSPGVRLDFESFNAMPCHPHVPRSNVSENSCGYVFKEFVSGPHEALNSGSPNRRGKQ